MRSKMVSDRERSALSVAESAEVNKQNIAKMLDATFKPLLEQGENLPDWEFAMELIGRLLRHRIAALVAADDADVSQSLRCADARARRDEDAATLFNMVSNLRSVVDGAYGPGTAADLGISGRTPRDPTALVGLAKEVIDNLPRLRDRKTTASLVTIDVDGYLTTLRAQTQRLSQSLDSMAGEAREAETTLIEKQRAMERYNQDFVDAADSLVGLYGLASAHELAALVRPSRDRTGQTHAAATRARAANSSNLSSAANQSSSD